MTAMPYFVAVLLLGQVTSPATDSTSRYPSADAGGNPVIAKAYIKVQDEASIPATEAGVLTKLSVREGARVKKDEVLATIDDREAQLALEASGYNVLLAKETYEQDIEERYAKAAYGVAKAEHKKVLEANRLKAKAVSDSEVERAQLDAERAKLQIEKAGKDHILADYDLKVKRTEYRGAKMSLERRLIRAPFDGDVVKTNVHQSEWVNPGEPILKLMRFDKLYVEGGLFADEYDRADVMGKPVTVEVLKARGRKVTVSGKIVHVEQLLMGTRGRYTVRAEVENELVNDSWLLQPGGVARMTIHLDGTAQATKPRLRN